MDFNEIFENAKEKVLTLVDKLIDFYEENKKLSIIALSSALLILICTLLLCISVSNNNKKKQTKIIPQKLILSEDMKIPDGPELPRNYNISRNIKDTWSKEESDEWFTVPSDKEIDALSKSNDAIINEILGATP